MANNSTPSTVDKLIRQYELIGMVFKSTDNSTLKSLATVWETSLPQIKERLSCSPDRKGEVRAAIRGLNQGLRDLPSIVKSADKDNYVQILARIKKEVGIQFECG